MTPGGTDGWTGRLRGFIVATLIVGFAAAIVLYVRATRPAPNPLGYEPEDTKQYLRDMELYGGKANLLASDIREWLSGLWHGRNLAFTVAALTIAAAVLLWLFGKIRARDPDSEAADPRPPI